MLNIIQDSRLISCESPKTRILTRRGARCRNRKPWFGINSIQSWSSSLQATETELSADNDEPHGSFNPTELAKYDGTKPLKEISEEIFINPTHPFYFSFTGTTNNTSCQHSLACGAQAFLHARSCSTLHIWAQVSQWRKLYCNVHWPCILCQLPHSLLPQKG